MGGSIRLFRVRGIDVNMHITFLLIVAFGALQFGPLGGGGLNGAIFGAVATLLLFACVLLHELGHALTALRYGVRTQEIILLPIGGIARLERIPDKPGEEFAIAIAGPLVNFAIVAALYIVYGLFLRLPLASDIGQVIRALRGGNFASPVPLLFAANLSLGLFNLVPAFPLDGGRILRAILASRLDYAQATALAVNIGQLLAIAGGFFGFLRQDFLLVLVAIFVYMGAGAEGQMVAVRSTLRGVRVRDVFSRRGTALAPTDPLSRAVDLTLSGFQTDFPVLDGDQLVGILSQSDLIAALAKGSAQMAVASVMRRNWRSVTPDEPLFNIQQTMDEAGYEIAAVVSDGRFLGLLTHADISEAYRLLSANPSLLAARHQIRIGDAGPKTEERDLGPPPSVLGP